MRTRKANTGDPNDQMKYDFLITYTVYGHKRMWFFWHEVIKAGSIRCKSKDSEGQAKMELERHLLKNSDAHHVEFGTVVNETVVNGGADILHLAKVMIKAKQK